MYFLIRCTSVHSRVYVRACVFDCAWGCLKMSACLCVTKSLMTALTFLLNKSHTFSLKAFFPQQSRANLQWQHGLLSGMHPQHFLTMWLPPAAFWLDAQRRGGWRGVGGGDWLAADTWEKTNSCPIAMEMSQQQVGGVAERAGGLWGTGWPAVVNNSSPYPAPKWLGKHGVLRSQKGPKGLREGHHPGVTRWQAHTGW